MSDFIDTEGAEGAPLEGTSIEKDREYHGESPEKIAEQAHMFANRLEKQYKHLRKWARRTGTSCYRLYDKDIPEIPLAVDLYQEAGSETKHLHIALYARPYDKPDADEDIWMNAMRDAAAGVLAIPASQVHTKIRRHQRGEESQYERMAQSGKRIIVEEGGSRLLVNLDDYLDTGLFLDHRPARLMVHAEAAGKQVLNLYSYTGAFSVHAASGGAAKVTSVDLSKTYLAWAEDNLALNGFNPGASASTPGVHSSVSAANTSPYACVHADVKAFLTEARRSGKKWDIIICDPPTFSNSKRSMDTLDINRDWAELCRACLALLSSGGTLYFSTNSRSLKFDPDLVGGAATLPGTRITDLTEQSIPEDFRNKRIHRLWKFTLA